MGRAAVVRRKQRKKTMNIWRCLLLSLLAAVVLAGCKLGYDDPVDAGDSTPPTATSGLVAAATGPDGIDLTWTAATDAVGVTGYRVERCQGAACSGWAEIATVPGSSTAYTDTGLMGSATYRYRVRATDRAGNLGPFSAAGTRTADLQTGLKTMVSAGVDRTFYLELPTDYDADAVPKPLIIAYHGTSLSHEAWLNGFYSLKESVGNGAILLYPDALFNVAAGYTQWDDTKDRALFEDLLDRLPSTLRFDPDRVFITGHSSGAGIADVLGCRYGDRIRAIAPVVGALTSFNCTGSIAVMNIVGSKDPLLGIVTPTRRFWVLYNGFDVPNPTPWTVPPCVDHSHGSVDYPVLWCLHDEGEGPTPENTVATAHDWPSFAGEAIWTFFSGLSHLAPRTEAPEGGGNTRALGNNDTTVSFTLRYPPGIPAPLNGTVVLFPADTVAPGPTEQPIAFMSLGFPLGPVGPGSVQSYDVPVRYFEFGGALVLPGSYTLGVFIYVEGGSFPQPAAGVDHVALVPVELIDRNTPVSVPGVLELTPFVTSP